MYRATPSADAGERHNTDLAVVVHDENPDRARAFVGASVAIVIQSDSINPASRSVSARTRTSVDVASTFSAASALRRTVDPRRIVLRAAHVVVGARIVVVRADVEAIASSCVVVCRSIGRPDVGRGSLWTRD